MENVVLSFLTGLGLAHLLLPALIRIGHSKGLCDAPNPRSSHRRHTPTLGGVAFYFSLLLTALLWMPAFAFGRFKYGLAGLSLLFLLGLRDDIRPLPAGFKLIVQTGVAALLVGAAGLEPGLQAAVLPGLPGTGVHLLSVFLLVLGMNAFNLIDGIDGLAAGIGLLVSGVLGSWFCLAGAWQLGVPAFGLFGALLAFLRYNARPARIFMGDSGSLLVGAACGMLGLEFLRLNATLPPGDFPRVASAGLAAAGVFLYPLFDTFRVVCTRIYRGQSPFKADRRHIHHMLIDYGFSHFEAASLLVLLNLLSTLLVLFKPAWIPWPLLLAVLLLAALGLTYGLHLQLTRRSGPARLADKL